eukprot:1985158-Rhodomonas_salina.1
MTATVNSASLSGFQRAKDVVLNTCALLRQLETLQGALQTSALASFEESVESVHHDAIDPTVTLLRDRQGPLFAARQFLVSFGNLSSVSGTAAEDEFGHVLAAVHDAVVQMEDVLTHCESAQRTRGQVEGMAEVIRQLEGRLSLLIQGKGQLSELSSSNCDSAALLDESGWAFASAVADERAEIEELKDPQLDAARRLLPVSYTHLRAHETEADL